MSDPGISRPLNALRAIARQCATLRGLPPVQRLPILVPLVAGMSEMHDTVQAFAAANPGSSVAELLRLIEVERKQVTDLMGESIGAAIAAGEKISVPGMVVVAAPRPAPFEIKRATGASEN